MYFTSFVIMPPGAAPMCPLHQEPTGIAPQPVSLDSAAHENLCGPALCHHPQLHMALAMWHEGFHAAHQMSLKAFVSMHAWVVWVCLGSKCLKLGKPLAGRRSVQELGGYPSATPVLGGIPADSNPVPLGLSTGAGELLREVTSLAPETEAAGSCSTGLILSNALLGLTELGR